MSKARLFVISCSMSIVISFIGLCYLMNNVNPDAYLLNTTFHMRADDAQMPDLFYEELTHKDNVHYGLEKASRDFDKRTPSALDMTEVTAVHLRKSYPIEIPVVKPPDRTKTVTVKLFPIKTQEESLKSKKDSNKQSHSVLLKILDGSGRARMEVIVDSGQVHHRNRMRKEEKDSKMDVYEIKTNETLLYNIQDQSLKVLGVDYDVRLNNSIK